MSLSNEALFLTMTILCMSGALLAYKFGRRGLEAFVIASTLSIYIAAGKVINVWDFTIPAILPVYSGIFLATDILTEYYGKQAGYRMIRLAFGAALFFNIVLQVAIVFDPVVEVTMLSNSLDQVIGTSLRIFMASITAYLIAQHFDVWFYHFLHKRAGGKRLWLRNNLSTAISQLLDAVIFVTIAFYGIIPNLIEFIIVVWLAKLLVALLDTPFMYLSRKITPVKFSQSLDE